VRTIPIGNLLSAFQETYGRPPTAIAQAPGRVEIIGNHTDYNGGNVIGAAINRYVWVAGALNPSGQIRLFSTGTGSLFEFNSKSLTDNGNTPSWTNYPLAVWKALHDFSLPRPGGFDLYISADLPSGAGLSSSAALELAAGLVLLKLAGHSEISPVELAQLCRHAETAHVGVPCGILDQGTCAYGNENYLVYISCREPRFYLLPFLPKANLWIFNTREKHSLTDGRYATRHKECKDCASILGSNWLTDVTLAQLKSKRHLLTNTLAKRAHHVISEHARTQAAAEALRLGHPRRLGELLTASHRSSQLGFENSTRNLDSLVDLLEIQSGVYGARLTGGGFGGAVMALTSERFERRHALGIAQRYSEVFKKDLEVFELSTAKGAHLVY
jgi:galactokinase